MRICVENGMFTVSFLKEGLQKVCYINQSRIKSLIDFVVPRVGGRFTEDFMGSVPRDRCFSRKPKCYGRVSYC